MFRYKSTSKRRLLRALNALDDEALQWLALACLSSQQNPGGAHIWPDGLGGFTGRTAIEDVRAAAHAWLPK